ncbi:MAG: fibronectin type III domain-containing protein [Ruminococcus sp.]|nr:fibronectin type III domain-containing protein [Ruminococcus sp.]
MDYNKQRKIVKALEEKGRNPLLFLPCLIAKILVIAFMSACRWADMALSDSEGNFLGRKSARKKRPAHERYGEIEAKRDECRRAREEAKAAVRVKAASAGAANATSLLPEEDEFSERELRRIKGSLPYRSFGARAASFCLAAAFGLMILPEINAGAAIIDSGRYYTFRPVSSDGNVTYRMLEDDLGANLDADGNRPQITAADLYTGVDGNGQILNLENNTLSNIPTLTKITLGYSTNEITRVATYLGNNFVNIGGGDAIMFCYGQTGSDNMADNVEDIVTNMLPNSRDLGITKVVTNDIDEVNRLLDAMPTASNVTARDFIGSVILEWDAVTSTRVDGYAVYYAETNSRTGTITKYNRIDYFTQGEGEHQYIAVNSGGRTRCRAVIKETGNTARIYAVRPYVSRTNGTPLNRDDDYNVCSLLFGNSDRAARALGEGYAPTIDGVGSGFIETLTISNVDPNAAFVNIYKTDSTNLQSNNYNEYEYMDRITVDPTRTTYQLRDPDPLGATGRKYIAVIVYAIDNSFLNDYTNNYMDFFTTVNSSSTGRAYYSAPYTEGSPQLYSPEHLSATVYNGRLRIGWEDQRNYGLSLNNGHLAYQITVNGKIVNESENNGMISGIWLVDVPADEYLNGDPDATVSIRTYFLPDDSNESSIMSEPATCDIDVNAPQIVPPAVPGNRSFTVEWLGIDAESYTIKWQSVVGSSSGSVVVSASDAETAVADRYKYTVTGVSNIKYEVWVEANNISNAIPSAKVTVTPATPPPAPINVKAVTGDHTVSLTWDGEAEEYLVECYPNSTGEGSPTETVQTADHTAKFENLINNHNYFFKVWALKNSDESPIRSEQPGTASAVPAPNTGTVNTITVRPDNEKALISISWNKVPEATEYRIRKTPEGGEMSEFSVGSANSYDDAEVSNNVVYTYQVKAVTVSDGLEYPPENEGYSLANSAKISITVPVVQGLQTTSDDGKVTLSWEKVDKADGYLIECATTDGLWQQIANVDGSKNKFEHTGLINSREYKYRIKAYRYVNLDRETVEGEFAVSAVSATPGLYFPAPYNFTVTAGDGLVNLNWEAVKDAEGYEIYVEDAYGTLHLFDVVTKNSAVHMGLSNGATITYCLRAFKTVSGEKVYSDFTLRKTAVVGTYLNAPTDIAVKTGDGQVTLSWKKSDGAEGYVVYSYNSSTASFTPVGIVTSTSFTHTGLVNGRTYTYMVAGYKTVNGEIRYSPYSLAATAVPEGKGTTGTNTNTASGEYHIYITGTTPYGMSNSNLISAFAENGAFGEDVDVRFTWSAQTTAAVQDVLDFYGDGIESFMIYPMDISLYKSGTDQKIEVNPGYYITLTIPVPDELLPYSESISVVHISDDEQLEILPSTHVTVSGVDCMQFQATKFSPYAFVVYLPGSGEDFAAGSFTVTGVTMEIETSASPVLMCTALPGLYGRRKRNKVYRIVK